MQGFMGFHAMASARGDGLRPELLALFKADALPTNVVDFSAVCTPVRRQSGPNAPLQGRLPDNVVPFKAPGKHAPDVSPAEPPRRPRVSRARNLSRKQS